MARGRFIAFEGIDGSGLTTQAQLLKTWLLKRGRECYLTKEPSDGPAGAMIRLALAKRLAYGDESQRFWGLDPATLAFLFAADRQDHLVTDVLPRLNLGVTVITDRYYLSSLAYQSLEVEEQLVRTLNSTFPMPDLTILIDAPPQLSEKRMQRERWHVELYEEASKLERIRQNYLRMAREQALDGRRIAVVDGSPPVGAVQREVLRHVRPLFVARAARPPADQLGLEPPPQSDV